MPSPKSHDWQDNKFTVYIKLSILRIPSGISSGGEMRMMFWEIISSLWCLPLLAFLVPETTAETHYYDFFVKSTSVRRLCKTKNILTINGQFPGPTLRVQRGDTVIVRSYNQAQDNITLHWHGVKQPRNPWSDGPEYITQCPIQPGQNYTYRLEFTTEEGTLWWHAHSSWARATVHGAIVVLPKTGTTYPFPTPHGDTTIILGEWWSRDVMRIPRDANVTGGEPSISDAYTINAQPGHLYPCHESEMFRMEVEKGRTYLLRIINSVMDEELFFSIDQHVMTLVGTDGSYTKQYRTGYLMVTPGQTMDVLILTDQPPKLYLMASRPYSSGLGVGFDHTTTTAMLDYSITDHENYQQNLSSHPLPWLPAINDTDAATAFTRGLLSLGDGDHPVLVPAVVDEQLFFTLSVNLINCTVNKPCMGPFGRRFAASVNNISFVSPSSKVDLLHAYYHNITGVFDDRFPDVPNQKFNYTADHLPENYLTPEFGTKVKVLEYNASVELVLQGTNVLAGDNHPVHLHGNSFYVIGSGFGNFDQKNSPALFNLVDPPEQTTAGVPKNGWVAIRFRADNPGVWLLHCHLERHQIWGMSMVFIVKNGKSPETSVLPPPTDLPSC